MGKKEKFDLSNSQKLLLLFQLLNRKKSDSINAKTRSKSAYKTDAKSKNKLKILP